MHAFYISAYGQRTQLTFNGNGTQTLTGDRGVSYRVQVKNGEVNLYSGDSNASMDIPVRTTQTTYFKDVNGKDIAPAVAQSNAIVGQDYTTTSKAIPGYTLTETPVNATCTVSNQKTTYVVGTTTTEPLYDDNGRQWAIATKTITDPASSITETLQVTDRNGNPISSVLRPSEGGSISPGIYVPLLMVISRSLTITSLSVTWAQRVTYQSPRQLQACTKPHQRLPRLLPLRHQPITQTQRHQIMHLLTLMTSQH